MNSKSPNKSSCGVRAVWLPAKKSLKPSRQDSLRHNEDFNKLVISPDSVRFAAAVLVSTANADLRVTRIEVDQPLHQLNFWLVSGADPAILPFLVTARPQDLSSSLAELGENTLAQETGTGGRSSRWSSALFKAHQPLARHDERPATIVEGRERPRNCI